MPTTQEPNNPKPEKVAKPPDPIQPEITQPLDPDHVPGTLPGAKPEEPKPEPH